MAVMGGLTPLNERTPLTVNIIMTYESYDDGIMSNAPLITVCSPALLLSQALSGDKGGEEVESGYGPPSYSPPPVISTYDPPSYSPPSPSYGAPSPSYGAPSSSYGAPSPSYGAPSYEAPLPSYKP